ncbi:CapA family protein [Nocardioides sambongensis]|uniref:CapA family protein n=1 Tax=Nocardioides sambongensis TaxID=2589074 RepID=UPI0015E87700|nr:CapA family protein [Nocardioides sambongensis]
MLAGCSDAPDAPAGTTPATGTTSATGPARSDPAHSDPAQTAPSEPAPSGPALTPRAELLVVGHAARPPLRLTAAQADRLRSGAVTRWHRGQVRVARTATAAARAVRAVEREPSTVAVVPPGAVGPTVTAAVVDDEDPVAAHPDAVTITIAGDLMLVRGVPDPTAALAPMRDRLRRADLTVGNLESTLSTAGAPTQGDDSFGADAGLVPVLRRAGFDAVSLANNHAGDYGPAALLETVDLLAASPVTPFGAGADLDAAARPAVLEAGGASYAFIGFNAIGETPRATATDPGALSVRMPPRTGPLVAADLDRVTREIRRADRIADAVVVLPHWGTQYTHTPEPVQRLVARRLVAAGADLVVGGHPHWVQGIDAVEGVPVLHSLGNFVFDMEFLLPQTQQGVLLESTWWGSRLKAIRLVPYAMDPGSFAPRAVTGAGATAILDAVRSTSTGPYAG